MQENDERSALEAAERRRQQLRVVADVQPDEPAKVLRPVAEHPEPTPYEKFGGTR